MNKKMVNFPSSQQFRAVFDFALQYWEELRNGNEFHKTILLFDEIANPLGYSFRKNFINAGRAEKIFHFIEYLDYKNKFDEAIELISKNSSLNFKIKEDNSPLLLPSPLLQLKTTELSGQQFQVLRQSILSGFSEWELAFLVRTAANFRARDISNAYSPKFWRDIVETVVSNALEQGWFENLKQSLSHDNYKYPPFSTFAPELKANSEKDFSELVERFRSKHTLLKEQNRPELETEIIELIEFLETEFDWELLDSFLMFNFSKVLEEMIGFDDEATEIIIRAKNHGWLDDLVQAASIERPYNLNLARIYTSDIKDIDEIKYELLSGFNREELEDLLFSKLSISWSEVSKMQRFVLDVITHAEDNGWLLSLVHALYKERPLREEVQELYFQIFFEKFPEFLLFSAIVNYVEPYELFMVLRGALGYKFNELLNGQEDYQFIVADIITVAFQGHWLVAFMHALYSEFPRVEVFKRLVEFHPEPDRIEVLPKEYTGKELDQFHKALFASYNRSSFARMLRYSLSKRLDAISYGENFHEIVFEVLDKSEKEGWIDDLLVAAANDQSQDPIWRETVKTLRPELLPRLIDKQ